MAIKNIIAAGIGFTEVGDGPKWIPTRGFSSSTVAPPTFVPGSRLYWKWKETGKSWQWEETGKSWEFTPP